MIVLKSFSALSHLKGLNSVQNADLQETKDTFLINILLIHI